MKHKLRKKKFKYECILKEDLDIEASCIPTTYLMVCNYGLVNGLSRNDILQVFSQYGQVDRIVMLPHKSYCFVCYTNVQDAVSAYHKINGKINALLDQKLIYLIYTSSVPKLLEISSEFPPGLEIIDNFITDEEETFMLQYFKENWLESSSLKHRQVKHYGYKFDYDNNGIQYDICDPIPKEFQFILNAIQLYLKWCPNQITVNKYLPGQGIPSHTDTHGIFDDYILSLSLGSNIIMEFKKGIHHNSSLLKSKSLLIMSGESRFEWTHGIKPRKFDIINTEDGPDIIKREIRISVTFRRIVHKHETIEMKQNLYEILGCNKTTNIETIKENYRKQLIKLHPDKGISSSADACAELNKAWHILKDPDSKKLYDEQLEQSDIDTEVTIFETLSVCDLIENNEMDETLNYKCRCGGLFLVPKSMVHNIDQIDPILFPCDDCSLFIEVLLSN